MLILIQYSTRDCIILAFAFLLNEWIHTVDTVDTVDITYYHHHAGTQHRTSRCLHSGCDTILRRSKSKPAESSTTPYSQCAGKLPSDQKNGIKISRQRCHHRRKLKIPQRERSPALRRSHHRRKLKKPQRERSHALRKSLFYLLVEALAV
jgi:hypothetical protein